MSLCRTLHVSAHTIFEFEGIELDESYSTPYACMYEDPENPANPLIRYLLALSLCRMEEVEGIIDLARGKYIDEVEIPLTEAEEDFLEEMREEEDSEDE